MDSSGRNSGSLGFQLGIRARSGDEKSGEAGVSPRIENNTTKNEAQEMGQSKYLEETTGDGSQGAKVVQKSSSESSEPNPSEASSQIFAKKTQSNNQEKKQMTNHDLLLQIIGNQDSKLTEMYRLVREAHASDELGKINSDGKAAIHLAVECGNYYAIPAISAMGTKYLDQKIGEVFSVKKKNESESSQASNDKSSVDFEASANDGQKDDSISEERKSNSNSENKSLAPLHLAAKKGDVESVKLLLMGGVDVNTKTEKTSSTPLHISAYHGHTEVVKALIEKGADVNAKTNTLDTPLHAVINYSLKRDKNIKKVLEIVKALIEKGADVNAKGKLDKTPLDLAKEKDLQEVVKILQQPSALILGAIASKGLAPLHLAAKKGDVKSVKLLLMGGVDVNTKTEKTSSTPLHISAYHGHTEVVKALIEKGADVNAKTNTLDTPLHAVINYSLKRDKNIKKVLEIVKALIEKGADVNAKGNNDKTPSGLVGEGENENKIKELLNEASKTSESKADQSAEAGSKQTTDASKAATATKLAGHSAGTQR